MENFRDWTGIASDFCVIVGALIGFVVWLYVRAKRAAQILTIVQELSPNGGSSVKDRIVKLETSQADQTKRLERIEGSNNHQTEKLESIQRQLNQHFHDFRPPENEN
jgi:uncharacterized coiled-coil protein SlyX